MDLYFCITTSIAMLLIALQHGEGLVFPNAMKCFHVEAGVLHCIVPKLDNSKSIELSILHTIPNDTEKLINFCTSVQDSTLSKSALRHLTQLRKVVFWNCYFSHLPVDALQDLRLLQYAAFHISRHYGDQFPVLQELPQVLTGSQNKFPGVLCSLPYLKDISVTNYGIENIHEVLNCSVSSCCKNVLSLNFRRNLISTVYSDWFKGLDNVTHLDLSSNKIEFLISDVFFRLQELKRLVLTLNPLKEVSIYIFQMNPNLSEIDFEYVDYVVDIPIAAYTIPVLNQGKHEEEFTHHECTEYTGIDNENLHFLNRVTSLSICLSNWSYANEHFLNQLSNLQKLSLKYPLWIPQAGETPSLVKLILKGMVHLTYLYLEYKDVHLHSKMFQNLGDLQHLSLRNVAPMAFVDPEVFKGLGKLKYLKIDFSEFFGDKVYLGELVSPGQHPDLTKFSLSDGAYHRQGLRNVEFVSQNAKVTSASKPRENMLSLTKLSLRNNFIQHIRKEDFFNCRNLVYLDLSHNSISSLYEQSVELDMDVNIMAKHSAFSSLSKLTHLILCNNEITTFDYSLLLQSVIYLDLSSNWISALTDEHNTRNSLSLQSLNLFNNRIVQFESLIFPPSLKQVFLEQRDGSFTVKITADSFLQLSNLEVFILRYNRKLNFNWATNPSRKATYFQLEQICQLDNPEKFCPIQVTTLNSKVKYYMFDFRIIPYYNTLTMHYSYCKYYQEYVCVEQQCAIQHNRKEIEACSVKVLKCTDAQLQTIPSMFPEDLEVGYLFLDGNDFSKELLDLSSALTVLRTIKILYLNNSHVSRLHDYAFYQESDVKKQNGKFSVSNSNLEYIYLQNNEIENIEDLRTIMKNHLKQLHLENNLLTSVPSGVCNNDSVASEIYLENNEIHSFNVCECHMYTNLKKLILRNNLIKSIIYCEWQRECDPVQDAPSILVDLSYNKISRLVNTLKFPFCVNKLHLQGNQITELRSIDFDNAAISTLRVLNLTYNAIDHIVSYAFKNLKQLQCLYLKGNFINEFYGEEFNDGKASELVKLEILDLSLNRITKINKITFRHLSSLKGLDLSGNTLTVLNVTVFNRLHSLTHLYLNHSRIQSIREKFGNLHQLFELRLNDNFLSSLDMHSFKNLINIKVLTLHNNRFVTPNVWKLPKSLRIINLLNNSLSCDCDFMPDFLKWLNDVRQDDSKQVRADYCIQDGQQVSLHEFDYSICQSGLSPSKELSLYISIGVLSLLLAALCVLYYKRLEMQVWIFSRYGFRLFYNNLEDEKRYDVFIAYSSYDEEFIINDLVPGLKDYSVCVHYKDFPPGAYITDSIAEAVENSSRTLLVFSPNFLESPWCKFEFTMAHNKSLMDRCCRLILIILGDIDEKKMDVKQKAYLKTNTYLRWDDPMFWEKLKFSLPTPRGGDNEHNSLMLFEMEVLDEK